MAPERIEKPPSLGWLLIGALVVLAAVWILVSAILAVVLGFLKLVIITVAAVIVIGWIVSRKAGR